MSARPPLRPYPRWARLGAVLLFLASIGAAALVGQLIPLPRRADRQLVSTSLMTGAMLLGTMGILVFFWLVVRRNAAIVDAAFAALGLGGERYLLRGRQYHGLFGGRRVDAYFVPARRYQPASLELYLGSTLRTRFSIGLRSAAGAVMRLIAGHAEIATPDPAYARFVARAADDAWARGLLHHPAAKEALVRLVGDPGGELRFVLIEPEAVLLRIAGVSLHALAPEVVRGWAHDLARLAHVAEGLPPPARALEAGAFERAARSGRAGIVAVVVIVALLLVLAMAGAAAVAMFQLGGRR